MDWKALAMNFGKTFGNTPSGGAGGAGGGQMDLNALLGGLGGAQGGEGGQLGGLLGLLAPQLLQAIGGQPMLINALLGQQDPTGDGGRVEADGSFLEQMPSRERPRDQRSYRDKQFAMDFMSTIEPPPRIEGNSPLKREHWG